MRKVPNLSLASGTVRVATGVSEVHQILTRGEVDQRPRNGKTPEPESNIAMGRSADGTSAKS